MKSKKEEAREFVRKFKITSIPSLSEKQINDNAKHCALICIQEIMYVLDYNFGYNTIQHENWNSIKKEVELL